MQTGELKYIKKLTLGSKPLPYGSLFLLKRFVLKEYFQYNLCICSFSDSFTQHLFLQCQRYLKHNPEHRRMQKLCLQINYGNSDSQQMHCKVV